MFSGPKARIITAWAEASTASEGPGNLYKIPEGLKGRNKTNSFPNIPEFPESAPSPKGCFGAVSCGKQVLQHPFGLSRSR
jgi:hypothetical protein